MHPLLREIIEGIVILDWQKDYSEFTSENTLPWNSKTYLFFTLTDEKLLIKHDRDAEYSFAPLDVVRGPQLHVEYLNFGQIRHVVAVNFKCGALHRLSKIPICELVNISLEPDLIFGSEIKALKQRLLDDQCDQAVIYHIERYFLHKLTQMRDEEPFDLALHHMLHCKGNVPIEQLANFAALSLRQFERKSLSHVGMSPKLFSRLSRFLIAYMMKENNPKLHWTSIAYNCGYYDQMHLIRDFKKFLGLSPQLAFEMSILPQMNTVTSLHINTKMIEDKFYEAYMPG